MRVWFLNLLIAIDQLANVLLRGAPDETLSARAHRMRMKGHRWWGWTAGAINLLFFWQADHCHASWVAETLRKQLPSAYEGGACDAV